MIHDKLIVITESCDSYVIIPSIPELGDLTNLRDNIKKAVYKLN
jgi:hypothetical protein